MGASDSGNGTSPLKVVKIDMFIDNFTAVIMRLCRHAALGGTEQPIVPCRQKRLRCKPGSASTCNHYKAHNHDCLLQVDVAELDAKMMALAQQQGQLQAALERKQALAEQLNKVVPASVTHGLHSMRKPA